MTFELVKLGDKTFKENARKRTLLPFSQVKLPKGFRIHSVTYVGENHLMIFIESSHE